MQASRSNTGGETSDESAVVNVVVDRSPLSPLGRRPRRRLGRRRRRGRRRRIAVAVVAAALPLASPLISSFSSFASAAAVRAAPEDETKDSRRRAAAPSSSFSISSYEDEDENDHRGGGDTRGRDGVDGRVDGGSDEYDKLASETETAPGGPNTKKKKKKPVFVLHVGPPKTGTTTFQCYSTYNRTSFRKEDGLYYLGRFNKYCHNRVGEGGDYEEEETGEKSVFPTNKRRWHNCLRKCRCEGGVIFDEIRSALEQLYRVAAEAGDRRVTVLYSNEILAWVRPDCSVVWDGLAHVLSGWEVHVIFTYRRYYEWLPSKYRQEMDPDDFDVWPDEDDPEDNSEEIPSFPSYLDHKLDLFQSKAERPVDMHRRWSEKFVARDDTDVNKLTIWNMHWNDGDFLTNGFCRALPTGVADGACAELLSSSVSNTSSLIATETETATPAANMARNRSSSKSPKLEWDRLVTAAYKKGWIDTSQVSRSDAREAVGKFAAEELNLTSSSPLYDGETFPLGCPPPDLLDRLLDESLEAEGAIVPDFFRSRWGEEALRRDFARAAVGGYFQYGEENGGEENGKGEKKFCSLDVDAILDGKEEGGPRWEAMFRGLGRNDGGDEDGGAEEDS